MSIENVTGDAVTGVAGADDAVTGVAGADDVDSAFIIAEKERSRLLAKYRQLWVDFRDDMDEIDDNLVPDDQCLAEYLGFELAEPYRRNIKNDVSLEILREIYPRHKAIIEAARHNLNCSCQAYATIGAKIP
jgi:hypothetical protein